jgi:membrane-associated phospholipid phosphatase
MTRAARPPAHRPRPSVPSAALGLAAVSAYVVLTVLVTTARTRGLDASAYELFRPAGVWGRTQRVSGDLVDGLAPGVAFSALGVVGLWFAVRRRSWRPAAVVGAAFAVTAVLTLLTKALVQRAGTDGAVAGTGSFPSGHAASVTVCLCSGVLLVRLRPRPWEWATLLLLATAATLPILAVGLHWLTDVVGGILLGVAVSVPLGALLVPAAAAPGAHERTASGTPSPDAAYREGQ